MKQKKVATYILYLQYSFNENLESGFNQVGLGDLIQPSWPSDSFRLSHPFIQVELPICSGSANDLLKTGQRFNLAGQLFS